MVPRYCTEECNCYLSRKTGNYITVDEAVDYAISGASSIRNGYDEYDTYAPYDLTGQSIGEILDELEEE